jgi:hypothetical protein
MKLLEWKCMTLESLSPSSLSPLFNLGKSTQQLNRTAFSFLLTYEPEGQTTCLTKSHIHLNTRYICFYHHLTWLQISDHKILVWCDAEYVHFRYMFSAFSNNTRHQHFISLHKISTPCFSATKVQNWILCIMRLLYSLVWWIGGEEALNNWDPGIRHVYWSSWNPGFPTLPVRCKARHIRLGSWAVYKMSIWH